MSKLKFNTLDEKYEHIFESFTSLTKNKILWHIEKGPSIRVKYHEHSRKYICRWIHTNLNTTPQYIIEKCNVFAKEGFLMTVEIEKEIRKFFDEGCALNVMSGVWVKLSGRRNVKKVDINEKSVYLTYEDALAYRVSTTEIDTIIDRISRILNDLETFPSENKKDKNKRKFDEMNNDDHLDDYFGDNYDDNFDDNYYVRDDYNYNYCDDDEDDFND